jgi:aminoglycoside phosphotransferase (APT) family kinase protein
MNEVRICRDRGLVIKRWTRATGGSNSKAREIDALLWCARQSYTRVPRVIAVHGETIVLELMNGIAYPEALAISERNEGLRLAASAGEELRIIHSLPPPFGVETLAWPGTGESWWEGVISHSESLARQLSFSREMLDIVADVLKCLNKVTADAPLPGIALCHRDFGGANVLVNGKQVSGVIDWEWACIADWRLDIERIEWLPEVGRSAHLWRTEAERSAFYSGYGDRLEDMVQIRQAYRAVIALEYLAVRAALGWESQCKALISYLKRYRDGRMP